MPRYRFADFILSPRRRVLLRAGQEQPLIPRYFDLLVFLVEHRDDAVHRREIFDAVWADVAVSDSALSQAIRTIRRVLEDDPREPRFVRTVSRHGYQFVFNGLIEEADDGEWPAAPGPATPLTSAPPTGSVDLFAPLLAQLAVPATTPQGEEEQRDAAERLHGLGTAEALRRLGHGRDSVFARALLRDTRWDTADAGAVPIVTGPRPMAVALQLVRLRLRRALGIAASRWAGASVGGGLAGALAGSAGGVLLTLAPGSAAPPGIVPVLAVIGSGCGACAAAGIGAGLAVAETVSRSLRTLALVGCGSIGGGLVGLLIQLLGAASLDVLVGVTPPIGGGLEGLAIGAAAGLGYALTTRPAGGGPATPRGRDRARVASATALACAFAALALTVSGRPLVGGTVHAIAQASAGAQAVLTPLGRLIGEPGFGPITSSLISMGEGAAFGIGLALGLTRRR